MIFTHAEMHDPSVLQAYKTASRHYATQLSLPVHHNHDSLAPATESVSNNTYWTEINIFT